MSDLISRQAALDAIRSITEIYVNNLPTLIYKASAQTELMMLPSAQPEQRWIPCSERLPEEYGEYRITWTTPSAPSKRFIGDSEYEVSSVWDEERNTFIGEWLLADYIQAYPNVEIIAWKPLEEPYKGEQE